MRIVKKNIPIYFGILRIAMGKDFVKICKKLKYQTPRNVKIYGAFVYPSTNKKGVTIYTVVLNPKASHSLIAHEVCHLVNAIFVDRLMKLDVHEDEPQAYLTGWVTKQIYKALKIK